MTKLDTVKAWLNNKLEDDEEMDVLVRRDPGWRAALHEALSTFQDLRFFRWERDDTLSVALDRHELCQAEAFRGLILNMPLPHEGPRASLKAVLTPEGVMFYTDIPHEERRIRTAPRGAKEFVWRDQVLELTFQLTEQETPQAWVRRRAADDLCALAFGAGHSRALEHAVSVAEDLQTYWLDILANVHHAFDQAIHIPEEAERQVNDLLRLRIHLDILAKRLAEPVLDYELENADELLAAHKDALLVLDEHTYEMSLEEGPVDKRSWWGWPLLLEERVPTRMVLRALEEISHQVSDEE